MPGSTTSTQPKRIVSIDALRGFDMFWISSGDAFFIALFTFINTPFFLRLAAQLDHPVWAGFRFYDIIFPLFLFIMGVVMPYRLNAAWNGAIPVRNFTCISSEEPCCFSCWD